MARSGLDSSRKVTEYRRDTATTECSITPQTIPAALGFRAVARIFAVAQVFAVAAGFIFPVRAVAQAQLTAPTDASSAPALVVAFVGGFVHPDDGRHSEVQVARELQSTYGKDVQVEIFRNRDRAQAHQLVRAWWNRREAAKLAGDENQNAPLILFGHSWGGSAVVMLARNLQRDGIPVSLTIQVDSVRKRGQNDSVIPANVAEAINFYQPDGIVHGRSQIRAADPSRTTILGNLRFKYGKEPAECRAYPWYDRVFFRAHTAIECDPRVWAQVERLIRNRLPSSLTAAHSTVGLQGQQ